MTFGSTATTLVYEAGLVLAGIGLMTTGVPGDNHLLLAIGCLPLTAVGLYHMWLVFSRRESFFSLCDIQAASLFIAYFGGAAVTLSLSEGGILRFWSAPLSGTLLSATIYIALFCAALVLLGRIESRVWRGAWSRLTRPGGWPFWIAAVLAAIGAAQAYMILQGSISYQGVQTIDGVKLPYASGFVVALSWPLAGVAGWVLGRPELRRRPILLLTCLALLPVQVVFSLSHGRRVVLFQCLIFAVSFLWARGRGIAAKHVVLLGVACLPLIYVLWVLFIGMRLENNLGSVRLQDQRNIFERLENTVDLMASDWTTVMRYQEDEVTDRVFVIGYVVDLIGAAKPSNLLGGRVLAWELVNGIPRFILPTKFEILRDLAADQESISMRYGLPALDRADSVLASGFADFHWFGVIYAPIVMLVGVFGALLIRFCGSGFYATYVLCYCVFQAIAPEQYFVTQSMNMIRLLVLITPIFLVWRLAILAGTRPYAAAPTGPLARWSR